MDTFTTTPSPAATALPAVPAADAAVPVFAFGPVLTVLACASLARAGVWLSPALLGPFAVGVVVGLWSPWPGSVPSLWTQSARDQVAAGRGGVSRAMAMLPALLADRATRAVTVAQLVGLAGGAGALVAVA